MLLNNHKLTSSQDLCQITDILFFVGKDGKKDKVSW